MGLSDASAAASGHRSAACTRWCSACAGCPTVTHVAAAAVSMRQLSVKGPTHLGPLGAPSKEVAASLLQHSVPELVVHRTRGCTLPTSALRLQLLMASPASVGLG